MTTKEYTYVKPWKYPKDYFGEEWYDYYTSIAKHRDSGLLDESNYEVFVKAIKALPSPPDWPHEENCYQVVSESHWAVGWIEWLGIHKDWQEGLDKAEELLKRIEDDYPILDEMDYRNRQSEAARANTESEIRYRARQLDREYTEAEIESAIDYALNASADGDGGDDGDGYWPSKEDAIKALEETIK